MSKKVIKKHNGTTTIINNGKIVTNYSGKGKKAPTAATNPKTKPNTETSQRTLLAALNNTTNLTADNAITICGLTGNQPYDDRMEMYETMYNQLKGKEQEKFLSHLITPFYDTQPNPHQTDQCVHNFLYNIASDDTTPTRILKVFRHHAYTATSVNYNQGFGAKAIYKLTERTWWQKIKRKFTT